MNYIRDFDLENKHFLDFKMSDLTKKYKRTYLQAFVAIIIFTKS